MRVREAAVKHEERGVELREALRHSVRAETVDGATQAAREGAGGPAAAGLRLGCGAQRPDVGVQDGLEARPQQQDGAVEVGVQAVRAGRGRPAGAVHEQSSVGGDERN